MQSWQNLLLHRSLCISYKYLILSEKETNPVLILSEKETNPVQILKTRHAYRESDYHASER